MDGNRSAVDDGGRPGGMCGFARVASGAWRGNSCPLRLPYVESGVSFIARDDVLIILGVATVIEILGDKFVVVDHFLDAIGTVARPAAGTLVASAMLARLDPAAALVLGLIVGGGTALTVHASKSVLRAKCTALLPFHGGVGNAAVSSAEDCLTIGGIFCIIHAPLVSFVIIVFRLPAASGC